MTEEFVMTDEFIEEVREELQKPESPFATSFETIRGVEYKVFTKAPANLQALYKFSLEKKSFIADYIIRNYGDDDWTFMVYQDERYTFTEANRIAARLAWQLQNKYGIQKGDRVVIAMRNYPEYCLAFMAITAIGGIAVLLNAWWEGPELEYGIENSQPVLIIADQERADRLKPFFENSDLPLIIAKPSQKIPGNGKDFFEVVAGSSEQDYPPVDVHLEDDAYILYTSGSTGRPKGVVTTHRSIINTLMCWEFGPVGLMHLYPDIAQALKSEYHPSTLLTVPLFHVTGLMAIFLGSFRTRRKLVMMYKWDPEEALRLIEKERITTFISVPTLSWELLNTPSFNQYDSSSLTFLGAGGAARPPEHVKRFEKKLNRHIAQVGYGLSETTAIGASSDGENYVEKPDSVGKANFPIMEAKIVDPLGRALGPDEVGEICFKGCAVMRGYWNNPGATEKTFLEDGWLKTGDIGRIDPDGFIFVMDRAKDIVIRGGENIGCAEVEGVLHEHPNVYEVTVFGLPDERLGEQLAAVVMVRPGETLTEQELKDHAGTKLAKFKIPQLIWIQKEPLARIASGKLYKRGIREEKLKEIEYN